jgi:hypothetical protein
MRKRIIPAVLMSLSIVAASCSDDETTSDSVAPVETTDGSAPVETTGDTEPGVTTAPGECTLTEPLKIGFAADLGELGAFSDQPGSEAAEVMVDIINDATAAWAACPSSTS